MLLIHSTAIAAKQENDMNSYGMQQRNIIDVAIQFGAFTTLIAAAEAANLIDGLKNDGPFTIFAPNDDAFAKLPAGTLESLLKPENKEQLIALLNYHLLPTKMRSPAVIKLSSAKTIQGQSILIKKDNDKIMINGAHVVLANIEATNGIIHVIDTVLLPK